MNKISYQYLQSSWFPIYNSERFLWSDETPEIKIMNSTKNLKMLILIFDSKWKYFLTFVGNFIHCMMHIFYKWRHFEVSWVKYFVTSGGLKNTLMDIPLLLLWHFFTVEFLNFDICAQKVNKLQYSTISTFLFWNIKMWKKNWYFMTFPEKKWMVSQTHNFKLFFSFTSTKNFSNFLSHVFCCLEKKLYRERFFGKNRELGKQMMLSLLARTDFQFFCTLTKIFI